MNTKLIQYSLLLSETYGNHFDIHIKISTFCTYDNPKVAIFNQLLQTRVRSIIVRSITSLNGPFNVGPMGGRLREVLLYIYLKDMGQTQNQ